MGEGDDRHSKSTAEFDRGELAKLASRSMRAPSDPGEPLLERLARGSDQPTSEIVKLEHNDRKTQRLRAKELAALINSGQAITPDMLEAIDWHADNDAAADADIEIPRDPEAALDELARNEPAAAAILHEDVASSSLIAQALAQLRAAGDEELRIKRPHAQTTEISPIEELESLGRSAPMSPGQLAELASSAARPASETIPMTPEAIAEITKTAPPKASRPAIEMTPLERPAAGTEPLAFEAPVAPRSDIGLVIVISFVLLAIAAGITGILWSV